jgi:hypothetical protein
MESSVASEDSRIQDLFFQGLRHQQVETSVEMLNSLVQKKLNRGMRFSFFVAGKSARHGSKVTVNSGLTTAVACARHGKSINRGGHVRTPASVNRYKKNKKPQSLLASPFPSPQ